MITLKESLLAKTSDKVSKLKDTICPPPSRNDWKKWPDSRWELWYVDYYCKPIIDKYIDILPDNLFDGSTRRSFHKIKKTDITTIRCVIGPDNLSVSLCAKDTKIRCEIPIPGFYTNINQYKKSMYMNMVIDFFERLSLDDTLLEKTFQTSLREIKKQDSVGWGSHIGIWDIR